MTKGATALAWTLSIIASHLPAISQAEETQRPQPPYQGIVTGTNVYVRSGPGEPDGRSSYYPCTKLSAPAKVTVLGQMNGWLRIAAPPGTYSVIYAQYVSPDSAGKTGTVTGDNVRVRAAGSEHETNFWQPQARLNKGAEVRILGQVTDRYGTWYKIVSPPDAHFWIYGQYVRPAGADRKTPEAPAAAEPAAMAADEPSEPAAPQPPAVEAEPAEPPPAEPVAAEPTKAPPQEPEDAVAVLAKIKQLEKRLKQEFEKPAEQRNLQSLLSRYQAMKVTDDSFAKPWLESRIQFLENSIRKKDELEAVESIITQTKAKQELLEMQRKELESVSAAKADEAFVAEGVLMASELFLGGPTAPRRYLLRDPNTLRIRAYVQSTGGKVDLGQYADTYVGIRGASQYDKRLAVDIVEVKSVDVLKKQVALASPAQPTVRPRPVPKPERIRPEMPPAPVEETAQPAAPAPQETIVPLPAQAPQAEAAPPAGTVEAPEVIEAPDFEPPTPAERPEEQPEVIPTEAPPAEAPEAPEPEAAPTIEPVPEPEPVEPPAPAEQPAAPKVEPPEPSMKTPILEPVRRPGEPETPAVAPDKLETIPTTLEPLAPPVETAEAAPPVVAVPTKPAPSTRPVTVRQPEMPEPTAEPPAPKRPDEVPAPSPETPKTTTQPSALMDPLPPTGLPMVAESPEPVASTLDEREYE